MEWRTPLLRCSLLCRKKNMVQFEYWYFVFIKCTLWGRIIKVDVFKNNRIYTDNSRRVALFLISIVDVPSEPVRPDLHSTTNPTTNGNVSKSGLFNSYTHSINLYLFNSLILDLIIKSTKKDINLDFLCMAFDILFWAVIWIIQYLFC